MNLIAPTDHFSGATAVFYVKLTNTRRTVRHGIGVSLLATSAEQRNLHWVWTDVPAKNSATVQIAFNLETALGRARVGRHGVGWQGVTMRQADACKEAQRRRHAPGRLNRVGSAVTPGVKQFVAAKMSDHAAWPALVSGQLRFLGLNQGIGACTGCPP